MNRTMSFFLLDGAGAVKSLFLMFVCGGAPFHESGAVIRFAFAAVTQMGAASGWLQRNLGRSGKDRVS